ncbi:MAG: hypothetical protein E7638_00830 [Ruminococcaceae bacterium]|nr:hypothetical protein [Oscillospiraceae bacterium]
MDNKKKSEAKRAAVCGILCAVCVVLLYLGSVTVFDLSVIALCAVFTMVVKVELGGSVYPWLYTAVTGVLALILLPSKLLAVEYILIGGIYPLVKAVFEKFHPVVSWVLKISVIDCMVLLEIIVSRFVFVAEEARIDLTVPAILLATVFAVLYDIALTVVISAYILKIRKRLGLQKLF